ncbi:hypothetical protein [Haloterrigena salifodinae]|uniref:hypothetical protein n=1 Tax=Haloterrigena salifodinae TaxID=2675099 RepID=UPI002011B8C4|nr:hypothetical protein [Haloterrigena salifodinae]
MRDPTPADVVHRPQRVPRECFSGFIGELPEEFDLPAIRIQHLEGVVDAVLRWVVCLSPFAHAGEVFAVVLGKPVVGPSGCDDTDIEARCEDGEQSTDRLSFATWDVLEPAVDRDRKRRWLVVRHVVGEKLGGREQILETRMALSEVRDEIGGESPGFPPVAAGDLEYARAQPVGDLLILKDLVTLEDSPCVGEPARGTDELV